MRKGWVMASSGSFNGPLVWIRMTTIKKFPADQKKMKEKEKRGKQTKKKRIKAYWRTPASLTSDFHAAGVHTVCSPHFSFSSTTLSSSSGTGSCPSARRSTSSERCRSTWTSFTSSSSFFKSADRPRSRRGQLTLKAGLRSTCTCLKLLIALAFIRLIVYSWKSEQSLTLFCVFILFCE